ncbi:MAG: BspA family leucine-rich repeat surface protein [Bacteroidales bacterium]|nr:BspA family leucine-rich repeat surface protein [Bacteroidales bacterium]
MNRQYFIFGGEAGLTGKEHEKPKKYFPKDRDELKHLLDILIKERGNEADFNDIDTSKVTDMSRLFENQTEFNGDISLWDTSNVTDMNCMFKGASSFNQDLSDWETELANTSKMFQGATKMRDHLPEWY